MLGRSRKRSGRRRPAPLDARPHLAAQIYAVEAWIAVHRIISSLQIEQLTELMQLARRDTEQRTQMRALRERSAHGHRRQALEPGAPQQLQEQGLGLVERMMRRQQTFSGFHDAREGAIACRARRGLDRHAALDIHLDPHHLEGNVEPAAERRARVAHRAGCRLQAVIDVHGAQRQRPPHRGALSRKRTSLREHGQEAGGIPAAGECREQAGRAGR
jgi:hypothetical protein